MTEQNYTGLDYWRIAHKFYWRQLGIFPFYAPLFMIPLFTDCLHANIFREEMEHGDHISVFRVLAETFKTFPRFIRVKLILFMGAFLWSNIPLIGWFFDFNYRIRWAMSSNVVVFENLSGKIARDRCKVLADNIIHEKETGVLFAIPNILSSILICAFAVSITFFKFSLLLLLFYFGALWILLPASAAVNTLLYLSIVGNAYKIRVSAA
jgi:hypothetical protein